jgi:hypothetical protein
MTTSRPLKALAVVFFLSGIWDTFAGIMYAFTIGTVFVDPPIHRFYALFIASFFFCFAYLQVFSAFNLRRYLFIVGSLVIGRALYILLLYSYIFGVPGFPGVFWWTGLVDLSWLILYILMTVASDEICLRDLFLPKWRDV